MNQLTQKHWTTKKEITIQADSLAIKTKGLKEDLEYKVKFEELGFDLVKKRIKSGNIPFYLFLAFDLLYLGLLIDAIINGEKLTMMLFWIGALIFFSIFTVSSFFNRNKDVVYLTGGQRALELLSNRPDTATVNAFIDKIHTAMREHYKNKFTAFDPNIPNEVRINQLKWLKDIKAISEKEYQDLVDKNRTDNIIGF